MTYADQHAHNVAWMTAQERNDYDHRTAALDERVRNATNPNNSLVARARRNAILPQEQGRRDIEALDAYLLSIMDNESPQARDNDEAPDTTGCTYAQAMNVATFAIAQES